MAALDPGVFADLEALVREVEATTDPDARTRARALVRGVLDIHSAGLARVLELAEAAGEAGRGLRDALAGDDLVASLLVLHGLHPLDLAARARAAVERLGPGLRARGGEVVLVGVTDGEVRLRVARVAPKGAALADLRAAVEDAVVAAAPDAVAVQIEVDPQSLPDAGFVPVARLRAGGGGP